MIVKLPLAEPAELVAVTVTLLVWAVVGVPDMVRLLASKLSPAGKPEAAYVIGAVPEKAGNT